MLNKSTYGDSTTAWYDMEFTTAGTYRIDFSYSCLGGNTDGYVALRI